MKAYPVAILGLLLALPVAASEEPDPPLPDVHVQVWLGGQSTDDDSWKIADPQSGQDALGDLGTLPFGGGAAQQLWGSGAWQFGYEGGGTVAWKNDSTDFRGTNNVVLVSIDNTFVSFGIFMGGVVSVTPVQPVRLYLAAGPSVTWAWLHNDDNDDDDPPPGGTTVIDTDVSGDDGSVVPYARAGIEIVLQDGFTFGVSVRYADDEFDFDDDGDLEFDEAVWLLTLGARL